VNTWAYTRYELLRTVRNRRFFVFSLGFPLVLFFLIAGPQRDVHNLGGTGISAPLYFMVGLVAFGGMATMLSAGARIAAERSAGWNRQLRITPLTAFAYFRTKVVTAYLTAALTIAVLYVSGAALGVSISLGDWLAMTALILVGLIPFAALGILIGHLLTADSVGPAVGGSISLFAFLGGTWFPLGNSGVLHSIAQFLPSYWLVQASHIAVGGTGWSVTGWAVVVGWTVVLSLAAGWAYRRDTGRV
jgi:ABC-2 type transport system permease protein